MKTYKPKAFLLMSHHPDFPVEEIKKGLQDKYEIHYQYKPNFIDKNFNQSLIITWNNYGKKSEFAKIHTKRGGRHFCIENGVFIKNTYCISERKHHYLDIDNPYFKSILEEGSRRIHYRKELSYNPTGPIVIFGQRGGKYSANAMPVTWLNEIVEFLKERFPNNDIVYKPHPHRQHYPKAKVKNLTIVDHTYKNENLFSNAFFSVVYTSSVSMESLYNGVPCFYSGPSVPPAQACFPTNLLRSDDLPTLVGKQEKVNKYLTYCKMFQFTRKDLADPETWGIFNV